MKIFYKNLMLLFCFLFASGYAHANDLKVNHMRTEYLVNPMGIDVLQPRLSWVLTSESKGQLQTGYQIIVGTDSLALVKGVGDVWNTKKVLSSQTSQIKYTGKKLQTGSKYYWKVKTWNANKAESSWSQVASWSMGLLNKDDWKAQWIGAEVESIPNELKYYYDYGFQSDFSASETPTDQWVMVDLGEVQEIKEIQLFPVDYKGLANGYLFPKRFKIAVSNTLDFEKSNVIVDESKNDFVQQGLEVYTKSLTPIKARYIKIVVNKLDKTAEGKYAFAFAELEVNDVNSKNVALMKKVTASKVYNIYPKFSNENWLPVKLTDGFYKANLDHQSFSLPIPPSPLLRKTFTISKKVKQATLYASALGLYEFNINGKKVGTQVLAPEWTDYHTRVQYQTYDVTKELKSEKNVIGAMLADGWYAGSIFTHLDRGSYGFDLRLLGQLEIIYDDGTKNRIVTDGSWKLLEDGPIETASLFDGETYNANLLPKNWLDGNFDDSKWKDVIVDTTISITRSAQMNEPIKVVEEITPVKISKIIEDTYIFDLGQNIAGWVNLKLDYNPHKKITFRHGEVLDEQGKLYMNNLRGAKQTNVYIPENERSIDYEPSFTYHGFRYVEVSGLTKMPDVSNVTGKVVASAALQAGSFESSSSDLNKLWSNILWTQRGNMHSVPTDCPQRDERAGWMGDAQVFAQTSIYNLDMGSFFTKWIRDIDDAQSPEGRYPDFTPQVGTRNNFYNSPGWSDAGVLVPWRMYENYGDTVILAQQYKSMKKYIGFILENNPDLLWKRATGNMYGDWLNGDTIDFDDYPKKGGNVADDLFATAFFQHSTSTLAKIAKILGKEKDYMFYDSLALAIKSKFVKEFVGADGLVSGNTQAGYALALEFDLVPDNLKKQSAAHMVQSLKVYDYRISTGIQTTIRLMKQLTAYGYNDEAYKLIESRRFPSWIYSIDQGATTIWERWDGYVKGRGFQYERLNSMNHYAIGAVGEWMYRNILGINSETPGFKHFIIKPILGGSLTWAKGSYHSIAGKIGVDWKVDASQFTLKVEIPVNTTATVFLPNGNKIKENGMPISDSKYIKMIEVNDAGTALLVQSGSYNFSVAL